MKYGWRGRLLHVDLARRSFSIETPDPRLLHTWIGGKGLAGYYLRPHITKDWDDPSMPILLFAGPLVGTNAPTSGRMTVMTRSPLTGTVGDTSVGGTLGTNIKRAGYDGIVISGASDQWVGLQINESGVQFESADHLLGVKLSESHKRLDPKGSVAMIGPAAENGVRFSSLMIDRHYAAARSGIGLSFAKKKLKYLTVEGSQKVAVADPEGLGQAREDIFRLIAASPILLGEHGIANFGTPALYDLMHTRRMMPTDNFSKTRFEDAPELGAFALKEKYHPKRTGCRGCHILCKKKDKDGNPLPEFETLSHFTALIGNTDLDAAFRANLLCNEYGMDTISAASTVACHAEIEGFQLDGKGLLSLIGDIAMGTGIGASLKLGSKEYAGSRGRGHLSMSVKGQELPAYDPRGAYGMALAYATSTRGGCHLRAYPISHEILRKPVATDRFSFSGKARIIKIGEDVNAVVDSLVACKFVFLASSLEEYAKAYSAVTGVATTAHDLSRTGERIYYHDRVMNHLNGFNSSDDDLPQRFFKEAGSGSRQFDVPPIDRNEFLKTRAAYYKVRGLDENGQPKKEVARELGVPWNS